MSTIAQPRSSSILSGRRIPQIATPTSSARPSLDLETPPRDIRSSSASPSRGPQPPRRNRAALREYYNLKKDEQGLKPDDAGSDADSHSAYSFADHSDVQESEMDRDGFDGEAYVKGVLEGQTLEEMLKIYNQVLMDIRALDAEKKALVYDNYSKLIAATETIRKMRDNMDPLNPMTSTLDPAIAHIYERANSAKDELRNSLSDREKAFAMMSEDERTAVERRRRAAAAARKALETPERLRRLMAKDKEVEARKEWSDTLRILEQWRDAGKGGQEVQDCIDDGEAALRGEPPNEKSWVNIKFK